MSFLKPFLAAACACTALVTPALADHSLQHKLEQATAALTDDVVELRRYFHEFPERPGALSAFLDALGDDWDVTLFHYRNHGSDYGRVLVGITSVGNTTDPDERLNALGYRYTDETNNPAYQMFLT